MFKELYWLALVTDFYLLMPFSGRNSSFFSPLQVMFRSIPRVLYSLALDLYDSLIVEEDYRLSNIFIDPFIEMDSLISLMYSFIYDRFNLALGSSLVIFWTKFTKVSG